MDSIRTIYISILWQYFVKHIRSEWPQKYSSYGSALENVDIPTKFAQAVYADMSSYFRRRSLNVKVLNYLTIHHYLQRDGFSERVKMGTLDIFSMYLGYKSFSDFIEKHEALDPEVHVESFGISKNPEKENKNIKRNIYKFSEKISLYNAVFIFVGIFLGIFIPSQFNSKLLLNNHLLEREKIIDLIHATNEFEFSLYKSVPNVEDTFKLDDFFTKHGTNIILIKEYLSSPISKNRKLRHSGSFFDILSIDIISISKNKAIAKTKEKWRLMWYNVYTGKDEYLYDVFNNQTYYLEKINERWKIRLNQYEGEAKTITFTNLQQYNMLKTSTPGIFFSCLL